MYRRGENPPWNRKRFLLGHHGGDRGYAHEYAPFQSLSRIHARGQRVGRRGFSEINVYLK